MYGWNPNITRIKPSTLYILKPLSGGFISIKSNMNPKIIGMPEEKTMDSVSSRGLR